MRSASSNSERVIFLKPGLARTLLENSGACVIFHSLFQTCSKIKEQNKTNKQQQQKRTFFQTMIPEIAEPYSI